MFVVVAAAVFILCSGAEMCTPLTSKGSDVVSWIPCYCPPPKKDISNVPNYDHKPNSEK